MPGFALIFTLVVYAIMAAVRPKDATQHRLSGVVLFAVIYVFILAVLLTMAAIPHSLQENN